MPLAQVAAGRTPYVLIDRTPFTTFATDRPAVQEVPASIYRATYPYWMLSGPKFEAFVEGLGYRLVSELPDSESLTKTVVYKGLYYQRAGDAT